MIQGKEQRRRVPPAEDLEPDRDPEPWVTLLPGLEPTPMGWRWRYRYLDSCHTLALFDRNGTIGPTVWAHGRVIGAWAQRLDGSINHHLVADPGHETRAVRDRESAPVTASPPCYRTPLERDFSAWPA
ncbi:DNA glycosylase AlkZ-like family protein [Streptomyces erythrochromogenes]|uniref:DNA glycosylase AlkZ-like family protein n=1 Tax=Streptomyces erythrochromogenes TaxID=285574 RepID=UPI0038B621E4